MFGELSADEDTGMEADEGEPGGLIGRKAKGAERGIATVQMGHVGRRGWHVRSRALAAPALRRCGVVRVPNSWCVSSPAAKPDGAGEESSGEGGLKSAWRRPGSSRSRKLGKSPLSIRARRDWEESPEHPLLLMSRPSGKRQCRTWRHSDARLRRGPRAPRQTAAGAPCVPEPRGGSGGRGPDRRPDAGPGAAVAASAADPAAVKARGSPASWRGPWRPAIGRTTRGALSRRCCGRAGSSGSTIGTCRPRSYAKRWPRCRASGAWIGTRLAMRFLALTAARSGEVRSARSIWSRPPHS